MSRVVNPAATGDDCQEQMYVTDNKNTSYLVDIGQKGAIHLSDARTGEELFVAHFNWLDEFGFTDLNTKDFYPVYPDDACLKNLLKNATYNETVQDNLRKANQAYHRLCDAKSAVPKEQEAEE